jgi:hypothetical protein
MESGFSVSLSQLDRRQLTHRLVHLSHHHEDDLGFSSSMHWHGGVWYVPGMNLLNFMQDNGIFPIHFPFLTSAPHVMLFLFSLLDSAGCCLVSRKHSPCRMDSRGRNDG